MRKTFAGLLAATAVGLSLSHVSDAKAVVNGISAQPVSPSWNARISRTNGGVCSGALVAEQWVLTAAHCVVNLATGKQYPASAFRVAVGRSVTGRGGYETGIDRIVHQPVALTQQGAINDLALLRLAKPPSSFTAPLALRSLTAMVPSGSNVTFYGWGSTGKSSGQALRLTQPGDWLSKDSCHANGQICYKPTRQGGSYPAAGDSGAPVVASVRGSDVAVGLFTGPGPHGRTVSEQYGASASGYLRFIRSKAGIPTYSAGNIIRDAGTGNSWQMQEDGFRRHIADGATYNCLRDQGAPVVNGSRYSAFSVPLDNTARASCTPRATAEPSPSTASPEPTQAPASYRQQQGRFGVNTFTNYHNASGMGVRIEPYAFVDVRCKVYDPYIESVNPDGYWYRIASPPWSDNYYAPANTFYNGDPVEGPYTHNTDFSVPDC